MSLSKTSTLLLAGLLAVVLFCGNMVGVIEGSITTTTLEVRPETASGHSAVIVAAHEVTIGATVTVLPQAGYSSYGASVVESRFVLFPFLTLREPDGWGALVLGKGHVGIELETSVVDANTISLWAADWGWQTPKMEIYVSADGAEWTQVGSAGVSGSGFLKYDFVGSFGEVTYIEVRQTGARWSILCLDAVYAERG